MIPRRGEGLTVLKLDGTNLAFWKEPSSRCFHLEKTMETSQQEETYLV